MRLDSTTQGQSAFGEECEQLYAAEQYEKLLEKFMGALDAVLASSSSDAGATAAAAWGAATACQCRFSADTLLLLRDVDSHERAMEAQ